jgi:hypothetical protein
MNAVGALGMGRSIATASRWLLSTALLICMLVFSAGAAADPSDDIVLAQAFMPPANDAPQMEMSTASLPRFDGIDGATRSSRIDMTLLPTPRSTLGPSVAMTSPDMRGVSGARPFANGSTSVDLGLRWRYTSDGKYRFDVTAWRRMNPIDAAGLIENRETSYGARVEMHLASAPRSGLVADHGFLGMQLESGARITLRKSGGKPMVYYRSTF